MTLSVQGGIGTHEENDFLFRYYNVESTGWGTPFLLVPEATTVDEDTLNLLSKAKENDVILSSNSPLGVRFHYLRGTSSDIEKSLRIKKGKPGSPCTEKHLSFNTEFTKEPICTASHKYQKLKIAQLQSLNLPEKEYQVKLNEVLDKECLCIGLSNAAAVNYKQTFIKKLKAVTICPGPNIANFSKIVSLQKMVDHIYGRTDIMSNAQRPHMFIAELKLYIIYLKEKLEEGFNSNQLINQKKYFNAYFQNLKKGISYYFNLPGQSENTGKQFTNDLSKSEQDLDLLGNQYPFIFQQTEKLNLL